MIQRFQVLTYYIDKSSVSIHDDLTNTLEALSYDILPYTICSLHLLPRLSTCQQFLTFSHSANTL